MVLVATAFVVPVHAQAQERGTVTGQITTADTGEPLSAAQVSIGALDLGSLSGSDGRFTIPEVPVGTHTLEVVRIGYATGTAEVTVTANEPAVVDLQLAQQALALQEIVATGLVDPVQGVQSPISVGRVSRESMPVTVSSGAVVENLAGRVAGVRINRSSGQPGEGVTMMLRSPTSLRGGGAPLIVVDGVVLSAGQGLASTVDLSGDDIESIEVIRGAAAASLYGSRAASGVIQVTTNRGEGLAQGQTRFEARTELGFSQNVRGVDLNDSHAFLMNDSRTEYVDQNGNVVSRNNRVLPPTSNAFADNPFPGGVYDNIGAITHAGRFLSNNFSVSGNEASTNFALTFNNLQEEGILLGNDGYERNSFRVNVDHRFFDALSMGVSVYHSRDWRDDQTSTGGNNPFNQTLYAPRDVDLSIRGPDGEFLQQPDPTVPYQNPVWTETTRDFTRESTRTLANMNATWTPLNWLSANVTVGYDRSDRHMREYEPKGLPADIGDVGALDGSINFEDDLAEAINGSAQLTVRRDFGPLNARATLRGLLEQDDVADGSRSGEDFILTGVPQLSNIRTEDQEASSSLEEIRALGYLLDVALDYDSKYILTLLGRRDGSSLFGPENRWHNYYRVAGAWRIAEEDWFDIPNVNELKLSVARGTAGGRPSFDNQYETWGLNAGIPSKDVLGNSNLAPELTTENEFSLSAIIFDRFGITLTHARQTTEDQITPVPLPAITGYEEQWVNTGVIEGHSTEFEFEAQLIQRPDFGWTSMIVADYSNAVISEWDAPCYAQGWRWNCENIPVYGIYSRWLLQNRESLNQHDNGSTTEYADQFQVNDEGFLVWVGEGTNYWEGPGPDGTLGTADDLWGTESSFTNSNGDPYKWGTPVYELTELGTPHRTLLGEGVPANFGWINNVRWGNFNFHVQMHASVGGQTNNRRFQFMANTDRLTAPFLDQAGKPDPLKKPIEYYREAIDGDTSYMIEDSSYLKMRTLSVSYQMPQGQLDGLRLSRAGIQDLRLGVIVRNVFTVTTYDGFDPESGFNLQSRASSDPGGYPPTRNLTAELAITF